MSVELAYGWSSRPDVQFPKSGLLEAWSSGSCIGTLGFRADNDRCILWCDNYSPAAHWATLIDKVISQSRKAKYKMASVNWTHGDYPDLDQALRDVGFSGSPLSRALVFSVDEDLQGYFDWKGRLLRIGEGKGSESTNARLYQIVASQFPLQGTYTELEVNSILNTLHLYGDQAGLRRELVDRGHLGRTRDCRQYWRIEHPEIMDG